MLELNTPTEPTIENLTDGQDEPTVLDLSKKGLRKVPKPDDAQHIRELILDENLLQKIDNIESFLKVEKVMATFDTCTHTNIPHTFDKGIKPFIISNILYNIISILYLCDENKKHTRTCRIFSYHYAKTIYYECTD